MRVRRIHEIETSFATDLLARTCTGASGRNPAAVNGNDRVA